MLELASSSRKRRRSGEKKNGEEEDLEVVAERNLRLWEAHLKENKRKWIEKSKLKG